MQVHLIGYCVEGSLFLVYEYIDNGNLSEHLRGQGKNNIVYYETEILLHSVLWLRFSFWFKQGNHYHGPLGCKLPLIQLEDLNTFMSIPFLSIYIVILSLQIFWSTKTAVQRW